MAMNPDLLAEEWMSGLGGRRTEFRRQMFRRLAAILIRHIQANAEVTSQGVDPQGGTVTSAGKVR